MSRHIVLRISVWLVASIFALTITVAALVYSGPRNGEAVSAVARVFFVQMWKGSHARATAKNACPTATPGGRVIQ
jgi:hypothetical protein